MALAGWLRRPRTSGGTDETTTNMEDRSMGKQARVALVLAAASIIMSLSAEWAIRHLTDPTAS
jgi:hypothetical protein